MKSIILSLEIPDHFTEIVSSTILKECGHTWVMLIHMVTITAWLGMGMIHAWNLSRSYWSQYLHTL